MDGLLIDKLFAGVLALGVLRKPGPVPYSAVADRYRKILKVLAAVHPLAGAQPSPSR